MSNIMKRFTKHTTGIKSQFFRKLIIIFTLTSFIVLMTITVLLIKSSGRSGMGIDSNSKESSASQSIIKAYSDTSFSDTMYSYQGSDSFAATSSDNVSIISKAQIALSNGGTGGAARLSKEENIISAKQSSSQQIDYIPLGIENTKGQKVMNDTAEYFSGRSSFISKSLKESTFYFIERLLDETTQTRAFIIAKDENYALNLNGYFYYLLDRTISSDIVSPFVLNISVLFDESSREEVCKSEEYAQRKHLNALKNSLSAALGKYYTEEVYEFIYEGYKDTFAGRIKGQPSKAFLYKLKVNELEIVFHNSFLTYIEFYIVKK